MKNTYNITIRLFDVFISLVAILALLPIFIIVIVILRFTGENEVFYLQKRVGFGNNSFHVIKFATMVKDSPNIGAGAITLRGDPRVLPFGHILRKTKINELPQLFNIVRGDMSLVGPRPLMEKQFKFYDPRDQEMIGQMKPGLTGIASIVFRDEEKYFMHSSDPDEIYRTKIAPSKALLEGWFYQNRSVSLYFRLILITVAAVVSPSKSFLGILDVQTREELENVLR